MTKLSKDAILAANDLAVETLAVPEWGGEVFIRPLTGDERDRWDQVQAEKRWPDTEEDPTAVADWQGLRAFAVALALCDEQGQSLGFTELEVHQLGRKNGAALGRVFDRIKEISGLGAAAVKAAEKNSSADPSASSGSSSQ